ncbi:hypothetical protein EDD85DRAFT_793537 [Armillaria nabsnona]|nr:hypothetical protein EDD85DRAFT_793537 [Armillaria nabsnona]
MCSNDPLSNYILQQKKGAKYLRSDRLTVIDKGPGEGAGAAVDCVGLDLVVVNRSVCVLGGDCRVLLLRRRIDTFIWGQSEYCIGQNVAAVVERIRENGSACVCILRAKGLNLTEGEALWNTKGMPIVFCNRGIRGMRRKSEIGSGFRIALLRRSVVKWQIMEGYFACGWIVVIKIEGRHGPIPRNGQVLAVGTIQGVDAEFVNQVKDRNAIQLCSYFLSLSPSPLIRCFCEMTLRFLRAVFLAGYYRNVQGGSLSGSPSNVKPSRQLNLGPESSGVNRVMRRLSLQ